MAKPGASDGADRVAAGRLVANRAATAVAGAVANATGMAARVATARLADAKRTGRPTEQRQSICDGAARTQSVSRSILGGAADKPGLLSVVTGRQLQSRL
jgi:hypothetical protein